MDTTDPDTFRSVENTLTTYQWFGGDDEGVSRAILACERALEPGSRMSRYASAGRWEVLKAFALRLRFERSGLQEDINLAKHALDSVISSNPTGSTIHTHALYELCRVDEAAFEKNADMDHLKRSLQYCKQALVQAKEDAAGCGAITDDLILHQSRLLVSAATTIPSEEEFCEAIALVSDMVMRKEDPDPLKAWALYVLSGLHRLHWRHAQNKTSEDLVKSKEYAHQALALAHRLRNRHYYIGQLQSACRWLFYASGGASWDSLDDAIRYGEEAAAVLTKNGLSGREDCWILSDLGMAYHWRFDARGRLEDIEKGVTYTRLATESIYGKTASFYVNLCCTLYDFFQSTGRLIDIDESVEAGQKCLELAPLDWPHMADATGNLGVALALRFEYSREQEDYQRARMYLASSIEGCRQDGSQNSRYQLSDWLRMLSNLHYVQFEVTSASKELDMAVDNMREAVAVLEEKDINRSFLLSELGGFLSMRYLLSSAYESLEDSISNHVIAFGSMPSTYNDRPVMLFRYSRALRLRFEHLHDEADINTSLELLTEALRSARSSRHPNLPLYLSEVGNCFFSRFITWDRDEDLNAALKMYILASETPEGFSRDRFEAAVTGARLAQEHNRLSEAAECFGEAISLLPRLAWLGLNTSRRHAKVASTASDLACDAAASAIMSGQLERAVEVLDQGRSIFWRSVLELRTDLRELETVAPETAKQLLALGESLEYDDRRGMAEMSESHAEERAQRRRRMAEQWESLVESVRKLRGFESFLKPLPYAELRKAATSGTIVILNVSRYRSDALIISMDVPVRSIPLPGLDPVMMKRLAYIHMQALSAAKDQRGFEFLERILIDISRRLWHGGLSAVAESLRQMQLPRRVWWTPTGLVSLLPIHCAGPYEGDHLGIPDLFISSYTTTLSALLAAQAPRRSSDKKQRRSPSMLAIAQPEVAGLPFLPSAKDEMRVLARRPFGEPVSFLVGSEATVSAVAKALPQYSWLHCCCHGHCDPFKPLDSALCFSDGSLTLPRIAQMRLANAEFAFLSACHTARHDISMPDESLHLSASMQIAGYSGVLGTAWAMVDRDGPVLAHYFYS